MNSSDASIRSRYDETNNLPIQKLMNPSNWDRGSYPLLLDVGPGNIKLRTAISLLDSYNAQYRGDSDFLGLNKYTGDLPQFISDLRDSA